MVPQVEDIRKENLLRKKWNFGKPGSENYPEGILMTGANSFIGAHVVSLLQKKHSGPVHLLLRAPSVDEAVSKMRHAFSQWGLEPFTTDNLFIHLGDVTKNMMNLTHHEFRQLQKQVGKVIHLAMTPLYYLPYHHFKRVWVPELERMIAFCGDPDRPKSLHYASSIGANFFQTEDDFRALNSNAWQSGYAGFKWVAAQSIINAIGQGLQGCIYDIPIVLGSETNGLSQGHYPIWLLLDIFLKTGYFCKFSFKVIPVDVMAEVMIHEVTYDRGSSGDILIRPMLEEPVDDTLFSNTVANILGLKESDLEHIRKAFQDKTSFDFMLPGNFFELMEKINTLKAVFPSGFDMMNMPSTPVVFMRNLNRALARKNEDLLMIN
jgi:thioester reductase-like protein